ncbi:S41 family peptidase [Paenibacillus monticola]|uniref:PDZ domain-containing protein n=1 Tax=Paenibacillus monticola TaxID=2666075 RepID=A0A7X2HAD4_9BACL|nr:S41 family peptidase [Paenibacillus monticola]MRN56486.1 PDZ domain-containing protein [Paenibacillus monticola]
MKSSKIMAALLSSCLALSIVIAPSAFAAEDAQASSNSDLINEVMNYLETYNLSGVDKDTLIRGAIDGMVNTLDDPYSQYFDKAEAADFENQVDLEYVGIGIKLQYTAKELYIEEIIPGSPAEQVGLKRGDTIVKINGQAVDDTEGDELSGAAGTKVTLLILRNGVTKSYSVTRNDIATTSVTGKIIGPKIAYITLSGFTQTSDEEFAAVLKNMRSAGMQSMVLDLRDNLGGYMDSAYNIASNFMDKGIMMYTSDQSGTLTPVTITDGSKINVPVVILTNEYTASASEALTGALRDNKLATVVGTRSFGKARIQSLLPMSNDDMLKLTTQKYLTPDKEDFNHIGLAPDIEIQGKSAQLITALQIAGMTSFEASGDNHILNINGSAFAGNVGLIKQGNSIYASARVLSALLESDITWDAKNKKVLVTNGAGKTSGFSIASKEALSQNDETFIELNAFKKKFPSLVWSYNAASNQLKLSVK